MPLNTRRVIPNTIGQGQAEEIAYEIDFTKWCRKGNPPTVATATMVRLDTGVDVTALNCVGGASVAGFVVTTPSIQNLIPDVQYRLNVRATVDGNILESWLIIVGEE